MQQIEPQNRILTRNFVLLFAGNFIVVSTYFLLMTTMALYALNTFGVDSATAGATASIFLVGGVLGRIVSGRYAQRVGLRRITLAALVLQIVACVLYFADGLGVGFLLAVRLVHGFSFGISNTTIPAMAVEDLPPSRIGEGTGYFMLSNSLGVGVGPMMSVLLVMGVDYQVLFRICTVLAVVVLVVSLAVKRPDNIAVTCENADSATTNTPQNAEGVTGETLRASDTFATSETACASDTFAIADRKPSRAKALLRSVIDTSTFRISVFMFLVAFSYSSVNSFVSSYAASIGLSAYAPFVFLVYSVALIVSRLFTGKLMDKFGENVVLYPSILSMAVGLVLVSMAHGPVLLLAVGAFSATGFGTCMSVGQAVATRETRCGDTALAISTFFLLCDGGCGVGPFFLGFVVDAAGYRAMYVVCACVALAALVYYHWAHGRRQHRSYRLL
jgi:MFS family permease